MTEASQTNQAVDNTPSKRPNPVTLAGCFDHVEKLYAAHAAALWDAVRGQGGAIWTYTPSSGPFADAAAFAAWVAPRAAQQDPYFCAIVDAAGHARGVLALLNIRPDHRVIEVGHVIHAAARQRTPLASEVRHLLARYLFEMLRYRRHEWKCDALNGVAK